MLVICAIALAREQAQAQVIVSDINVGAVGGGGNVGSDNWFAQEFSTPASTDYSLSSVSLVLNTEAPGPSGTFSVSLYSATGSDRPGTSLLPIVSGQAVSTLSSTVTEYTFPSPSPFTLSRHTSYFVVVNADVSSGAAGMIWRDTATLNPTVTGPGTLGGWTRSNDAGQSWDPVAIDAPFQLAVSGTPVPEPGAYTLLAGIALASFAVLRQLRTRKA